MNTLTPKAEISQFNTRIQKVWGEQRIIVECVAEINGEKYKIEFCRNPITGQLQRVECLGTVEDYTTENTLVNKVVADLVSDSLNGD